MTPQQASPNAGPGLFPSTSWTLILASQPSTESRRVALAQLLPLYWRPLYLYARRKGLAVEDAEDAVQSFAVQLIERDFLGALNPDKGRLRGYLRTSFDRYLINQHARDVAQKRGGGRWILSLDIDGMERELPATPASADTAFEREWALAVMQRALARLRAEYTEGARRGHVDSLFRYFGADEPPSYVDAAAAAGTSVMVFKAALHRARKRLRDIVREEVKTTVTDRTDPDDEVRDLFKALAS